MKKWKELLLIEKIDRLRFYSIVDSIEDMMIVVAIALLLYLIVR
jgi:hypothetical protein